MAPVWHPAPAIRALIAEANLIAPHRSKAGDGTIGDAAHGQRASDHNPEPDGTVDAADLTHDPAGGWDCHVRFRQLRESRDVRLSYVIFDGWWFRSYARDGTPAWTLMPYRGENKHRHHMHVSVNDEHQNDVSRWFPQEEDAMSPDQWKEYLRLTDNQNKALDAIKATLGNVATGQIDHELLATKIAGKLGTIIGKTVADVLAERLKS